MLQSVHVPALRTRRISDNLRSTVRMAHPSLPGDLCIGITLHLQTATEHNSRRRDDRATVRNSSATCTANYGVGSWPTISLITDDLASFSGSTPHRVLAPLVTGPADSFGAPDDTNSRHKVVCGRPDRGIVLPDATAEAMKALRATSSSSPRAATAGTFDGAKFTRRSKYCSKEAAPAPDAALQSSSQCVTESLEPCCQPRALRKTPEVIIADRRPARTKLAAAISR